MKKILIFFILIFLSVFIAGCDFAGDEARQGVAQVLLRLKEAINDKNRVEMEKVISDVYTNDDLDKQQFIDTILQQGLQINGYNMEAVELKEDNTQAKVVAEWRMPGGTITVRVPVFQQQVPSVDLTVYSRVRFYLQKEEKETWRIVKAVQLDKVRKGSYGEKRPMLTELSYQPDSPLQGESVDMRIQIQKAGEETAIFLAVNGILQGGYSLTGLDDYQLDDPLIQMFRIPQDFPKRSFYETKVLVFEGIVNQTQIDNSELTGLEYREVLQPVR